MTYVRTADILGRAEASPTQVIPIEIFHLYVCVYIYISAVRPSVPYIYLFYFNDVHSIFFN